MMVAFSLYSYDRASRLLERLPNKPWPNGRYAKSYFMVDAAVQSETYRPEGPYTNTDGVVYTANDLRTHSWAFWFNQTNHNASGVFNQVYNSHNPGDTVLTGAMRAADFAKAALPPRFGLHYDRNTPPVPPNPLRFGWLDLAIRQAPWPLRSLTGTTNVPNLPNSQWYALNEIPSLMATRQWPYGSNVLALPIGAVAPPQNTVPGNWTMNNAAQQGWTKHSAAWDRPFNKINQWYTWLVAQQKIQTNTW